MANINIKNSEKVKDKIGEIAKEIAEIMKQNVIGGFVSSQSARVFLPTPPGFLHTTFSDDLEQSDIEAIEKLIKLYFENAYPEFESEIVHGMDKDYFLPALKVLDFDGEFFYSPQRKARWERLELVAKCERVGRQFSHSSILYSVYAPSEDAHNWESCQCGIYGSVNLEEISDFLREYISGMIFQSIEPGRGTEPYYEPVKKLVIIEPSPDADVILCRKGWRAQAAFISEIVGETITFEEASRLLSIAWHRTIDVTELNYENR